MTDRTLVVAVIVIALATFGVATGSYTTVDATRDVTVATGSGYLNVTPNDGTAGEDATLLTIQNEFAVPVTSVDVQIVAGDNAVANLSAPVGGLETGETGAVRADVTCTGGSETVTVTISAGGDGVAVDAERDVIVDCGTPTPTTTATDTPAAIGPGTTIRG